MSKATASWFQMMEVTRLMPAWTNCQMWAADIALIPLSTQKCDDELWGLPALITAKPLMQVTDTF